MNRRLLGCGFACVVAVGATAYAQTPTTQAPPAQQQPPTARPPNLARQLKRWVAQSRSRAAS